MEVKQGVEPEVGLEVKPEVGHRVKPQSDLEMETVLQRQELVHCLHLTTKTQPATINQLSNQLNTLVWMCKGILVPNNNQQNPKMDHE